MNIKEVQPRLAEKLTDPLRNILREFSYSLPKDYQPKVFLLDSNGRKKKSNASAENWSPESGGRIEIRFVPAMQSEDDAFSRVTQSGENGPASERYSLIENSPGGSVRPSEEDLLRALDRTENRPGWNFVPLKKFRDEILPIEHCPSMVSETEQRNTLRAVIDKRYVLLGKVPNPKAPQYPVTTIRLNRLMPEVRAALGKPENPDLDFHPAEIRGEHLSATILRERR